MHKITIIGKPGCHLCKKARDIVEHVVGTQPVLIEEIDISDDADLEAKYHEAIPVVLVDGIERFRHEVDANKLVDYLGASGIVGIDH
jgi:glutaredoxin